MPKCLYDEQALMSKDSRCWLCGRYSVGKVIMDPQPWYRLFGTPAGGAPVGNGGQ